MAEMPKSILKLRRGDAQEHMKNVVKSVTFKKSVKEGDELSDESSELEETLEVSQKKENSADNLVKVNEEAILNHIKAKNTISEKNTVSNLNTGISKYPKLIKNLETAQFQQPVIKNNEKNIGNVDYMLKEHYQKMVASFAEIQNRTEKIIVKIPTRKRKILELIERYNNKIKVLIKIFSKFNNGQRAQLSAGELRKIIVVLRKKFKQIKRMKNKLILELRDINNSKALAAETLRNLKNKKEEISCTLSLIKLLTLEKTDTEEDNLSLKAEFELLKAASEEGIRLALENKITVENYLQKMREEIQNKVDFLSCLEEQNFETQGEIRRLKLVLEKAKNNFENTEENCQNKTSLIEEKLSKIQKDLEENLNKKKIMLKELDDLKTKYLTLCEGENKVLVLKTEEEIEFCQAERNLRKEKCRNEAQIEKDATNKIMVEESMKNKEQLQEKGELPKKPESLEDLVKKLENLKKEIRAENEARKKEIKIEDVTSQFSEQIMSPSILKSPRKTPRTPQKKATFLGVSTPSGESFNPETREETFDDFIKRLETLAASTPRQPPAKKRRIDFD